MIFNEVPIGRCLDFRFEGGGVDYSIRKSYGPKTVHENTMRKSKNNVSRMILLNLGMCQICLIVPLTTHLRHLHGDA